MDIQNFIAEFKKTFIYDMLCESLEDEQLFEHSIVGDKVVWFKVQTSQMWSMWQAAQADTANQPNQMTISFDRFEELINKAVDAVSKTVAVPEGFVSTLREPTQEIYRTDFEIIKQTLELVDLLASSTNVFQRDPKSKVYPFESENPRVTEWWRTACQIQELLTNTDPNNCDFEEYKAMIEAQEQGHE